MRWIGGRIIDSRHAGAQSRESAQSALAARTPSARFGRSKANRRLRTSRRFSRMPRPGRCDPSPVPPSGSGAAPPPGPLRDGGQEQPDCKITVCPTRHKVNQDAKGRGGISWRRHGSRIRPYKPEAPAREFSSRMARGASRGNSLAGASGSYFSLFHTVACRKMFTCGIYVVDRVPLRSITGFAAVDGGRARPLRSALKSGRRSVGLIWRDRRDPRILFWNAKLSPCTFF